MATKAIKLDPAKLISLRQLAIAIGVSPQSTVEWARVGRKGTKLKTEPRGVRLFSSMNNYREWLRKIHGPDAVSSGV